MSELTFEQKIVKAALYSENGDPMKDVLDEYEMVMAVERLSDVYIALGIVSVAELDT